MFGFAKNLGTLTTATTPVVFSFGLVRDPAVEYIIANNVYQARSLYFWSKYTAVATAVSEVLYSIVRVLTVSHCRSLIS